jgi:hypothetical protein
MGSLPWPQAVREAAFTTPVAAETIKAVSKMRPIILRFLIDLPLLRNMF